MASPEAIAPVAIEQSAGRKRRFRRGSGDHGWLGYLFVAPNFIGFSIFTLLPLIFAFVVSFADWDVVSGIDGITWVG
jgi:ABC-type sugar transport system permease subunit